MSTSAKPETTLDSLAQAIADLTERFNAEIAAIRSNASDLSSSVSGLSSSVGSISTTIGSLTQQVSDVHAAVAATQQNVAGEATTRLQKVEHVLGTFFAAVGEVYAGATDDAAALRKG